MDKTRKFANKIEKLIQNNINYIVHEIKEHNEQGIVFACCGKNEDDTFHILIDKTYK